MVPQGSFRAVENNSKGRSTLRSLGLISETISSTQNLSENDPPRIKLGVAIKHCWVWPQNRTIKSLYMMYFDKNLNVSLFICVVLSCIQRNISSEDLI